MKRATPNAEKDDAGPGTLGRAIREARKGRFTQQQLADAAGVSQPAISQVERGRGRDYMRSDYLLKIAGALGVDPRRLQFPKAPITEEAQVIAILRALSPALRAKWIGYGDGLLSGPSDPTMTETPKPWAQGAQKSKKAGTAIALAWVNRAQVPVAPAAGVPVVPDASERANSISSMLLTLDMNHDGIPDILQLAPELAVAALGIAFWRWLERRRFRLY